jgi:hypothetical protein
VTEAVSIAHCHGIAWQRVQIARRNSSLASKLEKLIGSIANGDWSVRHCVPTFPLCAGEFDGASNSVHPSATSSAVLWCGNVGAMSSSGTDLDGDERI